MSDGVDDDRLFFPQEFKNDSIRAVSYLVETTQFSLQRIEFCRVKVGSEPGDSIGDPFGNGRIEFL